MLPSLDPTSPQRLRGKKLNNSVMHQELDEMVDQDEDIRREKLEIEKIKRDHQKELERYLKQEIGKVTADFRS